MDIKPKKIVRIVFLLCFAVYVLSPLSVKFCGLRTSEFFSSHPHDNSLAFTVTACNSSSCGQTADGSKARSEILLMTERTLLDSSDASEGLVNAACVEMMPASLFGGEEESSHFYGRFGVANTQDCFYLINSPNSPPHLIV